MLPSFKVDDPMSIDMRSMPPTLAEVYVHAILNAIEQRSGQFKSFQAQRITFLVPPFDPDLIMWPTYVEKLNRHYSGASAGDIEKTARLQRNEYERKLAEAEAEAQRLLQQQEGNDGYEEEEGAEAGAASQAAAFEASDRAYSAGRRSRSWMGSDDEEHYHRMLTIQHQRPATSVTGLAVAATCRRAKIFARVNAEKGKIDLVPREFNRWVKNKQKYEEAKAFQEKQGGASMAGSSMVGFGQAPGAGRSLAQQQRNIRMGMFAE